MIRLTFESPHNIGDVVFVIRVDGSVVQGCVTNIILRVASDRHELSYEVQYNHCPDGKRLEVFLQENVYSDPNDAFCNTYKQ